MATFFEKCSKTPDCEFGIKQVDDENVLKQGPCIITVLPTTFLVEHINGSLRQVAKLVNPDIDTNYNPNRRILGIGFKASYINLGDKIKGLYLKFELEKLVKRYFTPLFIENNHRIDCIDVMKNFRNLTFVTYCNGTNLFSYIEYFLKKSMHDVGYKDDEIKLILSQICLAAISGTTMNIYGTNTLAFTFGDIMDMNFGTEFDTRVKIYEMGQGFINYNTSVAFAISGDGNHSFKRHMTGDDVLSPMIKKLLEFSLDNALEKNEPITYEKMEEAMDEINKGITLI
ncbi:MAG: hypothetical protein IJR82_03795 [Bacilli bacterium]|nr:hypothetical protein [Bacilli bacterium]